MKPIVDGSSHDTVVRPILGVILAFIAGTHRAKIAMLKFRDGWVSGTSPGMTAVGVVALLLFLASPAHANCSGEISAALERLMTTTPVRKEMTTKGAAGIVTSLTENDLPRALRVRTEGGERGIVDTIVVGDSVWLGDGREWRQQDGDRGKQFATVIREQMTKAGPSIENPQCGATETVDGKALKLYTYDQSFTFMTASGKSSAKLFVDPANGLPIRQEVISRAAGAESHSVIRITYDKTIKVEPPK
jgi:hypothetical protein